MSEQVVVTPVADIPVGFSASPEELKAAPGSFAEFNQLMDKQNGVQAAPAVSSDPAPEAAPAPIEQVAQPEAAQETPTAEVQPVQPEQPQATETAPEVPKKFLDKDGKVRLDALVKSYREAEKALSRSKSAPQAQPAPIAPNPVAANPVPIPTQDPFISQIENDVKVRGLGAVLADLFHASSDVATNRVAPELKAVAEEVRAGKMKAEIERIAEEDPEIVSDHGRKVLLDILKANPFLNDSENPLTDAYYYAKGKGLLNKTPRAGAVKPNPTAPTMPKAQVRATAPSVPTQVVKLDSMEALQKHLSTLPADKQMEFMAKNLGWKI